MRAVADDIQQQAQRHGRRHFRLKQAIRFIVQRGRRIEQQGVYGGGNVDAA